MCKKLIAYVRTESDPISILAPQVTTRSIPYQLRSGNTNANTTIKGEMTFPLLGSRDSIYYNSYYCQ